MKKEDEIKISIIIPIYNAEKYLNKCINSIIIQSLKEIEIICVNDGSTDNSLNILEDFKKKDKRIRIINQNNSGASKARNIAIKNAKGKYCLNIDSDDWIEQEYLKDIYERAERDNLDILITNIIFDYSKNKITINDLNLDDTIIITGKEYIKKFFYENKMGFSWNKLIKRELYIRENLFFNENIFLLEDMELIGKLGYHAKRVGKLNKAYYHYIQGIGNGSQKVKLKNLADRIEAYNNLINYFKKYGEKGIIEEIKKDRDISLISELIGKDFYKLNGYSELFNRIVRIVREERNNIKGDLLYTKYQLFTTKCIKKINFISPEIQLKIFKLISKIKNILSKG